MGAGASGNDSDPTTEARRAAVCALLKRYEFEHDLLVKRTAAFLTLNGLMAASVAAGDRLPNALKLYVAGVMILVNVAWLFRAVPVRRFIHLLSATAYSDTYADVLPEDARLHKQQIGHSGPKWFTMTTVFSIGIPISLLLCWAGGIVIAPLTMR